MWPYLSSAREILMAPGGGAYHGDELAATAPVARRFMPSHFAQGKVDSRCKQHPLLDVDVAGAWAYC